MATDTAQQASAEGRATGFFCSTSGTYFSDKESLAEHYRSDFHRYNLKRKVAGLPPVTKEWFEARKAQLASAASAPTQRVWYDPLTRRKFMSEAKYREAVGSKKYAELVKRSGAPAPAPVVMLKRLDDAGPSTSGAADRPAPGFQVKAPARPAAAPSDARAVAADLVEEGGSEDEEQDEQGSEGAGSGWETASASDEGEEGEEEEGVSDLASAAAGLSLGGRGRVRAKRSAARPRGGADAAAAADGGAGASGGEDDEEWEEWDVRRSLFDNRVSGSMQENLEYMYKNFGFYFPDVEFLTDPEGLLRYLGSKLQYGKVPLYTPGDDPNARQFRSLHAVQRHMVDANRCKMAYDDNEDEYADYYDYGAAAGDEADGDADAAGGGGALVAAGGGGGGAADLAVDGLELVVGEGSGGGGGGKVLGSRWLARYYKQRPRPTGAPGREQRAAALAAAPAAAGVVAQYRALGIETRAPEAVAAARRAQRAQRRGERSRLNLAMKANILHNLPKNVTY
ncbi:hypothetical protein MNEG_10192 [Monoraphidium neglectum]|uniref:ZN622/Rei1/Reh1 zinc finger C2H2-type domain-containing protein n=1 Tax=Monoraphidium neglectum TaxID=145388 RepID=A0A0D2M294_9CHLO|nr:hypothetical protein MNEG_10192 [Monoraphidium neglectum]KIY97769.1 hypothetical protein MNEG_10192 [Monoraphidium neglectum]|eukprot:XP_013896789.1 hypothetical protein MNEG_10192 [Monoraphidium neglectum]